MAMRFFRMLMARLVVALPMLFGRGAHGSMPQKSIVYTSWKEIAITSYQVSTSVRVTVIPRSARENVVTGTGASGAA